MIYVVDPRPGSQPRLLKNHTLAAVARGVGLPVYRSNGTTVEVCLSSHAKWAECVPPWCVLSLFLEVEKSATLHG